MHSAVRLLRRGLWLVWGCALVCAPVAAAASPSVTGDFDGDGKRDYAEMNRRESAIRIWFSVTQSTTVIRSATPLLRIAARDLDGDKRDELIASGPSAGLQVWTQHRKGFGKLRPKRSKHPTLAHPTRHKIEDGPVEDVVVIDPTGPPPVAISLIPHSRAPAPRSVRLFTRAITGPNSVRVLAPLGSRPPPLSI